MAPPEESSTADDQARQAYWEEAHTDKGVTDVSWWQPVPGLSLDLIERAAIPLDAAVIDVGAGWSTLVDHLLARGYTDLTAVDLSSRALETVSARLGQDAAYVDLIEADVLHLDLGRAMALWHDRAVFHFLTEASQRADYVDALTRHTEPGSWAVVATFGPEGPTTCSGLPVVRYDHADLAAQFPGWSLEATAVDRHTTPWGTAQPFTAVLLRREH